MLARVIVFVPPWKAIKVTHSEKLKILQLQLPFWRLCNKDTADIYPLSEPVQSR